LIAAEERVGRAGVEEDRIERTGLLAGRAVRGPQAQRRDRALVLGLERDPRSADLGVGSGPTVDTEGAVLIDSNGTGQEEPVIEGELLLDIAAERHEPGGALARRFVRGAGERLAARRQRLAEVQGCGDVVAVVLETARRLRADPARQLERGGSRQV